MSERRTIWDKKGGERETLPPPPLLCHYLITRTDPIGSGSVSLSIARTPVYVFWVFKGILISEKKRERASIIVPLYIYHSLSIRISCSQVSNRIQVRIFVLVIHFWQTVYLEIFFSVNSLKWRRPDLVFNLKYYRECRDKFHSLKGNIFCV